MIASPDLLDIDLASAPGAGLLDALRRESGEAMARAACMAHRLFLLRSPWAPGMRCVGGEMRAAAPGDSAREHRFSVIGASDRLPAALAACVGEGVERVACIERPGDASLTGSCARMAGRIMPAAWPLLEVCLRERGLDPDTEVSWQVAASLGGGAEVLMPADWCLRRADDGPLRLPGTALSTGVAAGRTREDAIVRALLELVERDAASLWWHGGMRGRCLAAPATVAAGLARLRADSGARRTQLLDITTDLEAPCVAAWSMDEAGRGFCCGLAARLTLEAAASAAVLEMCQMELGLMLASMKRAAGQRLADGDRRHLERAEAIDASVCMLLQPDGAPVTRHAGRPDGAALRRLEAAFARLGITAAVVDLTRPDLGVPVVRAIAPALQPLPGKLTTARLDRTIAATGGGNPITGGVALL